MKLKTIPQTLLTEEQKSQCEKKISIINESGEKKIYAQGLTFPYSSALYNFMCNNNDKYFGQPKDSNVIAIMDDNGNIAKYKF